MRPACPLHASRVIQCQGRARRPSGQPRTHIPPPRALRPLYKLIKITPTENANPTRQSKALFSSGVNQLSVCRFRWFIVAS